MMLGAVCHDLGKPATTAMIDGRMRSPGHEAAGVAPTTRDARPPERPHARRLRRARRRCSASSPSTSGRARSTRRGTPSATARSAGSRRRSISSCWRGSPAPTATGGPARSTARDGLVHRARASARRGAQAAGADPAGASPARLGVTPGPRMGEILREVYERSSTARDDGGGGIAAGVRSATDRDRSSAEGSSAPDSSGTGTWHLAPVPLLLAERYFANALRRDVAAAEDGDDRALRRIAPPRPA